MYTESLSVWCLRSTGLLLLGVLGYSTSLQSRCRCNTLEGSADSGSLKPEPSHSGSGNFKEKIISSVVPVEDSSRSRLVFQSCAEHRPLCSWPVAIMVRTKDSPFDADTTLKGDAKPLSNQMDKSFAFYFK